MPRPAQDFDKRLISFRQGDIEKLQQHFPNLYYNAIVRSLVEQFVDALEEGRAPTLAFDPNKLHLNK